MAKNFKIKDFLKRIKNPIDIEDGVNYKRITISGNHKGVSLRDNADGSKIGTKKQFLISGGDFILSKIDARNGAFGIVPENLDGAIITGNFWTYKVDKDLVDTEWFFYFTHSFNFIQICIESSTGSTHRKYLDEKIFLNHDIILPSKTEQVEMVKKYKEQSEISINLKQEIEHQKQLLAQFKQAILQEAIQGKLTENWCVENKDIEAASQLLKRIKAEKAKLIKEKKIKKEKDLAPISKEEIPFEIPENWVWCRLGEVIVNTDNLDIQKYLEPSTIINYVDIDAIDNKRQIIRESKKLPVSELSSRARRILKKGQILYSLVRPYLHNLAIVEVEKSNYIGSTGFAVFNCLEVETQFIFRLLLSKYIEDLYLGYMDGFNSPSITHDQFRNTVIPLPPLSEQKAIVEKVESLMAKCTALEQEITQSEQYANMLMQAVLKEAFESEETESKEAKVTQLPALGDLEDKHFVKRKMLASYIINQSANDDKFGDTKFEKLLHLTEYHLLKRNFGQEYKQKAAGPYDNKFTVPFFQQTIQAGWFYKKSLGNMNRILPAQTNGKSQTTYDYFSNEELQSINGLIETFKSFDYKIPEIISTLYAVWNNRIIQNQEITDELLKQDFLAWDEGKAQYVYPKDRVTPAIKWMNDNNFIPDGWGKVIEAPKSKAKKK